jgi:hypothetical protein
MLRRHEADVLAFIRARLDKTRNRAPRPVSVPELEPALA